jgi:proteasome lid subunit RPN8/RPN11
MNFSIRAIIRGLVAPEHFLSCSKHLWNAGLSEMKRRGAGRRESGAFLLGEENHEIRQIHRFVYYDDLDPHCLDQGYVRFNGSAYGPLWQICHSSGLKVIGDIHTHPGAAIQSNSDRQNPMVAIKGHIALIVPCYANKIVHPGELGIYEYEGSHRWRNHSGKGAARLFYIGIWG